MYRHFNDGVKLLTGANRRFTETGLAREKAKESFFRTLSCVKYSLTMRHRTVHAIVEMSIHSLVLDRSEFMPSLNCTEN